MLIDFHTHVLPGIDDGAADVLTAVKMLTLLRKQGTHVVVATPHFYAHRQTMEEYLQRRKEALSRLPVDDPTLPTLVVGAEVYLEHDLREWDLRPLCMGLSNALLIEMPYSRLQSWMLEEVYSLCIKQELVPVFAHLDRYLDVYSREELQEILDFDDAVIQVNTNALFRHHSLKKILGWIREGRNIVVGSDCHNLDSRSPRNDRATAVLQSKLGKEWLTSNDAFGYQLLGL